METVILVLHILAALTICGLVLLQHGKGADAGAAFGSGASGSVFGASGSANFLSRATAIAALVFFLSSLGLTWYSSTRGDNKGVMATQPAKDDKALPGQVPAVPAEPAAKGAGPGEAPKAQDVPK